MNFSMQMTSNAYKNLRLFLIVFAATALILGCISYAKGQTTTTTTPSTTSEKVEQVQQQVAANNSQIDATTVTAIGGTAAAGIAVIKGLLDQRKNTTRDRTTDVDAGRFIILMSKFYQAKYLYPHMTDKEILDLPISNNPMSKMTLGQAITTEAELWANGNQTYWGVPSPQMSVPTQTTVAAIKSKEEYPRVVSVAPDIQTQAAPTQQAGNPATNVQTSQQQQQQKPANTTTSTTNTTVGK